MADAPGNDMTVTLGIAGFVVFRAQDGGKAHPDAWFFRDHKYHKKCPP